MKKRMLRIAACCLAAGLLMTGQAVLSAGASEDQAVAVDTEAPKSETETETKAETEPAAEQTKKKKKKKKKQTEATSETGESSVDLSMKGQMIFAQCEENINIRKGPGTDSEVVGKIYNNCMATILSKDGDWFEIQSGNAVGFVKAEYFATGKEAEAIAEEVGYHVATVYADELNVRALPADDAEVIAVAYKEEELEAVSYEDDWIKVYLGDDVYGYVNAYYAGYDTYYPEAETLEEEQARLDAEAAAEEEYVEEYVEETLPETTYDYYSAPSLQSSEAVTVQPQTQAQTQPETQAETQAQTTASADDGEGEANEDEAGDDMYYDAATGEMKKFE